MTQIRKDELEALAWACSLNKGIKVKQFKGSANKRERLAAAYAAARKANGVE